MHSACFKGPIRKRQRCRQLTTYEYYIVTTLEQCVTGLVYAAIGHQIVDYADYCYFFCCKQMLC